MADRRAALAAALGFDPAAEGLDPAPGEAADLLELAAALRDAPVPEPAMAETDRLVAALAPFLPAADSRFGGELAAAWAGAGGGWLAGTLAAVSPQVRLLRRPFWIASAAVVAAGLPLLDPGLRAVLGIDLTYAAFLVITAPALAALGVAYAFRSAGTGRAEVELACPLTPAQLVLGRLFWVAAYDAALLAAASVASAGLGCWPASSGRTPGPSAGAVPRSPGTWHHTGGALATCPSGQQHTRR